MDAPARPVVVHYEPKPPAHGGSDRDDVAYIAPMLAFLLFTWAGSNETIKKFVPAAFQISYVAKTVVVATLLVVLRRHYTKIRWNHWWLGVIVGIIGIFQWVPMQL